MFIKYKNKYEIEGDNMVWMVPSLPNDAVKWLKTIDHEMKMINITKILNKIHEPPIISWRSYPEDSCCLLYGKPIEDHIGIDFKNEEDAMYFKLKWC